MWYRCCHAARLIKARRVFVAVLIDNEPSRPRLSSYVEPATAVFANWLAPKKWRTFHFGSFCVYYIPHNYVIPQAMPHTIPQIHSAFYPHRKVFHLLWEKTFNKQISKLVKATFQTDRIFSCELLELHLRCKKNLYNSLSVVTLFYIDN